METAFQVAQLFGRSLDRDEFKTTASLLDPDCVYDLGTETLVGPKAICDSYEQNMLEGRQKFDKLEWGQSSITPLDNGQFEVHFTDYLGHKGIEHIHRCKQLLTVSDELKITAIQHVNLPGEPEKLAEFKQRVGLG